MTDKFGEQDETNRSLIKSEERQSGRAESGLIKLLIELSGPFEEDEERGRERKNIERYREIRVYKEGKRRSNQMGKHMFWKPIADDKEQL